MSKSAARANITDRLEELARPKEHSNDHYFIDSRKPEESITKVKKGKLASIWFCVKPLFRSTEVRSLSKTGWIGKPNWFFKGFWNAQSRVLASKEKRTPRNRIWSVQWTGETCYSSVNGSGLTFQYEFFPVQNRSLTPWKILSNMIKMLLPCRKLLKRLDVASAWQVLPSMFVDNKWNLNCLLKFWIAGPRKHILPVVFVVGLQNTFSIGLDCSLMKYWKRRKNLPE